MGREAAWTAVAVGSWLSGDFILVTNAFKQHPLGYAVAADGSLYIADIATDLFNEWRNWMIAPFPFIANTAGWMTAELGRQP